MNETHDLPLPTNFTNLPNDVQESINDYLSQLDEKERKAYCIAYSHLGSSFSIQKSIGYLKWKSAKKI
jgi:hypothetical protein